MGDSKNIIIYGDSLSAGYGIDMDKSWPTLLQNRLYSNKYDLSVINSSISGETTQGGVTRIENILKKYSPKLVVIELGGNDGLRGFQTDLIKNNLQTIIQKCLNNNSSVVLLGIKIPLNYGPRYTQDFENIFYEVAIDNEVDLVDFFMKNVALDENLMQDDGIHPNESAQPILLENVWETIKKNI